MLGAILGDMIGAPYEFDQGDKTKEFPLFNEESDFTDDSVMTVAVGEALLKTLGGTDDEIREALVKSMQKWGRRFPVAGYGANFIYWIHTDDPLPYNSCG
ncbi:MAG: ADP-ribosylglycohydrolase family protein, partial [Clostridia bacterium]|nr:ADP-ribosylglycohydrolase family protein [Clostridia bacterium]